jgi:S-adenosylmethionine:tRNA ribosyltransferase-isomerase
VKSDEFSYELPPERVAQAPADPRDSARMMVVHRQTGRIEHAVFKELPGMCHPGDVLVINNTRVISARIWTRKRTGGGKVEVLLLEEAEPGIWEVMLKTRRRLPEGALLDLPESAGTVELLGEARAGRARVRFNTERPVLEVAARVGVAPLPPYIKRRDADEGLRTADRASYQTIFAREDGAVAAPTAGLHFTEAVLEGLRDRGAGLADVTLHVGPGTFRPVSVENVDEHVMEPERYFLTEASARRVVETKRAGGRVVAVGSTSVRVLEHVAARFGELRADAGRTGLFIRPPYDFRVVDAMLTNFHLPRSTLLMLVCALAGRDLILQAYREAVRERYRFYSYGDCMLIL